MLHLNHICLKLYEIDAIKFGHFILKSGIVSPFYIDLRVLISYPNILRIVGQSLYKKIQEDNIEFNVICGVPCAALPLATSISIDQNIPSIFKREGSKQHGTKKLIEGNYNIGDKCLIIEDVVTSGISILETANVLMENGLEISDACFIIDREGGGVQNLAKKGIKAHCLLTISYVMNVLLEHGKINQNTHDQFVHFQLHEVKGHPITPSPRLPFNHRKDLAHNQVAKKLCQIIDSKKSNLIFSADFSDVSKLLEMVDLLGSHICCVKTHVDILKNYTNNFPTQIRALATKHNFLIMEDRKFADIGYIMQQQYSEGLYKICEWADIVTVHGLGGQWSIEAIKQATTGEARGCILIAEMSNSKTLFNQEYTQDIVRLAERHKDVVVGLVCQRKLTSDPSILHFSPGVKMPNAEEVMANSDALGQQYNTPEHVIGHNLSDIVIVGRDIYESNEPLKAAIRIKEAAYNAYLKTL